MQKTIRMRYLYCKMFLGWYRRWWFAYRLPSELREAVLDRAIAAMDHIWQRMSEAQRRFIQMQPDPRPRG